jgi:hypothetical protein
MGLFSRRTRSRVRKLYYDPKGSVGKYRKQDRMAGLSRRTQRRLVRAYRRHKGWAPQRRSHPYITGRRR